MGWNAIACAVLSAKTVYFCQSMRNEREWYSFSVVVLVSLYCFHFILSSLSRVIYSTYRVQNLNLLPFRLFSISLSHSRFWPNPNVIFCSFYKIYLYIDTVSTYKYVEIGNTFCGNRIQYIYCRFMEDVEFRWFSKVLVK